MASPNLYEVLGVPKNASADDIKSAFRSLARQHHPDVNQGDPASEEKFKELSAAYAVLSDPEKRAQYDQFGTVDPGQGGNPADFFSGAGGFGDLFDMFFGGGGQPRRRKAGRDGGDIRYDLTLNLLDVLNGAERKIKYKRNSRCTTCEGSGAAGGKAPEECKTCHGAGQVSRVQNTFIGQVRTMTACPTCGGEGYVIKEKCQACNGRGTQSTEHETTIKVPPGFDTGMHIHYPGEGHQGTGQGRSGDLYVVLNVKADDRFERENTELYTALEIGFPQVALGDQVTIEGIEGDIEVDVPAGTQPGTVLRVKGQGVPNLHGGRRGDMHVEVVVRVPNRLNEEQERLVRELAATFGEDPKASAPSLLGSLFKKKK